MRPAEADAWHHVFGDDCVIDISGIGNGAARVVEAALHPIPEQAVEAAEATPSARAVQGLVNRSRAIADGPSPYRQRAVVELRGLAADDPAPLHAALAEIAELLAVHERRSARTADSEWLQLITAKRLLQETLGQLDTRTYSS